MSCECESGGNYECQFNLQNCSSWNSCVCYKSGAQTQWGEEQAFLTSLAGLILVLFWIVPYIYELLNRSKDCLHCKRAVSAKGKAASYMSILKVGVLAVAGVLLAVQFKMGKQRIALI